MNHHLRNAIAALLVAAAPALLAACATAGPARSVEERFFQADQKMPDASAMSDDAERSYYIEGRNAEQRGLAAQHAGNQDQMRAELGDAAQRFVEMLNKFAANDYQIPIRYHAAELFLFAYKFEPAGEEADKVTVDPHANAKSKAMGSHLAAEAWLNAANQAVKAGKLDPVKIVYQDQRKGPPSPRPPPGAWGRFVGSTDRYLASMDADPDLQRPASDRRRAVTPARLALIAAEVEYAFDNIEDAQRRFAALIDRWPGEAETLEDAVPIYLQTFLALNDGPGYQAAVAKVKALVDAEGKKATEPRAQAAYAKLKDSLGRAETTNRFADAQRLLEAGKSTEAAQAFEALAAGPGIGSEAAIALHNAALAWDRAKEPAKAAALRARILKEFPDAKVAPDAELKLAEAASKRGEHGEASRLYAEFLQKWKDHPNRCVALQNIAAELDLAKQPLDAAEGYLVFGKDAGCAKADPNFAARALYRSGVLFATAKKNAKAKEAFGAAAALPGVTDTVAKSQVDDAKSRLKGL
jgi:TolA-binding protein